MVPQERLIAGAGILCAALVVAACAPSPRQYASRGAPIAVGTDVQVDVRPTESNSYRVDVVADHLTPPERLGSDMEHYVVWFREPGKAPQPQGTLQYDEKSRSGELTATTVRPRFEVLITAERSKRVAAPSRAVIAALPVDLE